MKVDISWIKEQYILCREIVQILGSTDKIIKEKYAETGIGWNDSLYKELGEIVLECTASIHSALQEIFHVIDGLDKMTAAVNDYLSVNLNGGTSDVTQSNNSAMSSSSGTSPVLSTSDADSAVIAAGEQWASQITTAQRSALYAYTDNSYYNINSTLRGNASFFPGNEERAVAIHQALSGAEIPCQCVVYRGASEAALGQYQNLSDEELVGCVIRDRGFMSTTLERDSAFMGSVQFEISVPQGAHGAYLGSISRFADEREVLFDAMQRLEITGVRRGARGERIISARMLV